MTQFLPPNLLALFAPRDPIPYLPPANKLPHEKKTRGYSGVGQFLAEFEDPKDTPPPTKVETREERVERRGRERSEQVAYKLEQEIAVWDPNSRSNTTTDPFKTLFVARINYDTSESKLRREFEAYGHIEKIVLIHNTVNGKPRGYAFIEYEHEKDMHTAYKRADGQKIDGRRVLVDVERARTVKGWLPRRLGGGLGATRRGGPDVNIMHSGREDNERERKRYYMEHEREERGRDRERDQVIERRRSRSRERRRRSRSRSRDRKRRRSRDRIRADQIEEIEVRPPREKDRERDRDRDRDRERKRRRSKSRDRDRERKRDRKDRRERERGDRLKYIKTDDGEEIRVKEEPLDDYPDYPQYYSQMYTPAHVKSEDDQDEQKYEPDNSHKGSHHYDDEYEEGEAN